MVLRSTCLGQPRFAKSSWQLPVEEEESNTSERLALNQC